MFYSITGELVNTDAATIAVNCGGVAFLCATTRNTQSRLGPVGSAVTVYTHLNVREDAMDLYGFFDKAELDCFRMLINVTGVGPKAALSILSEFTPDKLALCIAANDAKSITRAQNVGPKLAQRIVLELKDKLTAPLSQEDAYSAAAAGATGAGEEAVSALVMLGYSRADASVVVGRLDQTQDTQELIRQALKQLARPL